MKLLLDDKAGKAFGLNANEACIYAAILKCTKAGRGWFANYRDLASAMPFVVSRMTVTRAVEKLFNLGLIERRENALFASAQNEQIGAQNEQGDAQIEQICAQNEQKIAPLNNLPINKENMNENENATCAHTCDTRTPETPNFLVLHSYFIKKGGTATPLQMEAAKDAWQKCSDIKKRQLIEAVKSGAHFKPRLDWLIADFPEPKPVFLRGDEAEDIVQVRYNGAYKLCTRATMELFGLEWVRDW